MKIIELDTHRTNLELTENCLSISRHKPIKTHYIASENLKGRQCLQDLGTDEVLCEIRHYGMDRFNRPRIESNGG